MEVSKAKPRTAIPQLLINSAIVGARFFRTNLSDVKLINQLAPIGQSRKYIEDRAGLLEHARLLDAFAEARVQLGPGQEAC